MAANATPVRPSAFAFGTRKIGPGAPVLVIAEIGINHEGDAAACAHMIEAAARAGADAMKLQTVDPDESYAPGTESHALFSRAVLSREATAAMVALARRLGIEAFTTAGDRATIDWVRKLNPAGYKISSGLLTTTPLVEHAARQGLPLLLSTGMAEIADIDRAVNVARRADCRDIGLMQCTSVYPAAPEQLNLDAIRALERRFDVPVGFSDHSLGIEAPPLAVAAGATMIEKHLTFDKSRPGFDHRLSLMPDEFAAMVRAIRRAEMMLGNAEKTLGAQERTSATRYHRKLAVRHDFQAGHTLCEDDISFLRMPPGTEGLEPDTYWSIIGRKLKWPVARYHAIVADDLE
jgi:N,N'-diacetyllegionaminate synthase